MALRILVLDDEPIVCKRLKPAFQKSGYEVETFTDSAAALQRMAEAAFDVIITDLKGRSGRISGSGTRKRAFAAGADCGHYRICNAGNREGIVPQGSL